MEKKTKEIYSKVIKSDVIKAHLQMVKKECFKLLAKKEID